MPELRPDPDHDAVCESLAQHQVVLAPPGTGKTCLSIRLAGQLVGHLSSQSAQVLVVTFSNQARTQLEREAARQLAPALRQRIEITNYHRFFWHAVLAYRRALGLSMRLDVGSHNRRKRALEAAGRHVLQSLERHEGLIDSLAEHAYAEFRDERTPPIDDLEHLLGILRREQREGRLVFDDLGALFWELLERFPVLDEAYGRRFPVVIADEHQDASALQDAVVRRLGQDRLVVLADPMQLIHGFRGANAERLQRHLDECGEEVYSLTTPHRWHGREELAQWLLAVRARLQGEHREAPLPAAFGIRRTRAEHGLNAVKLATKIAVFEGFRAGARTIAVLGRTNREVAALRLYLSQQGLNPRQIGGDFEEARADIEQLPLFRDARSIALHALERLVALVPTLPRSIFTQAQARLGPDGVNLRRANSAVAQILGPLKRIYAEGPERYIEALVEALDACSHTGHHLPRAEAVLALRDTAAVIAGESILLDDMLARYSEKVMIATHVVPRVARGLLVMTAHQAKGKEFDAVVLADVNARYWPDDDETRRLLYVAITRATARWTIIAPDRNESPLLRYLP
jgi:superfamily I DNA/RNA helicase